MNADCENVPLCTPMLAKNDEVGFCGAGVFTTRLLAGVEELMTVPKNDDPTCKDPRELGIPVVVAGARRGIPVIVSEAKSFISSLMHSL